MEAIENNAQAACECGERNSGRISKMKADLSTRLNIAEGQIRGIKNLIEKDAYCDAVLNQLAATRAALKSISMLILQSHIKNCLVRRVKNDEHQVVDELLVTINRMV